MISSDDQQGMSNQLFPNCFLVSLSRLVGDYFQNTVTLILEHTPEGAFGLVINRPLDIHLDSLIENLPDENKTLVLEGGPVEQTRLFFLHSPDKSYTGSLDTGLDILLSSADELIEDLKENRAPAKTLSVLGYAGWGPGQLENELVEDAWLITPASSEILFDTPFDKMAFKAARQLGVDLNLYQSTTRQS